jgi:hypothetical protein
MTEERDPRVSWRYRELGAEEPPRELDQAILAAAHRAADRAHAPLVAPAGRHRWYFAFGAAAILVLAVAITVQVEQRPDAEALLPPTVSVPPDRVDRFDTPAEKENKAQAEQSKPLADAGPPPARERRKAPPQQAAPAASPPAEVKPQAAGAARADRLEARQQQAPAVEPQNTQAPASPAAATASQPEKREQAAAAEAALSRPAPAAAPAPAPRAFASAVALPPERLLERIAELRKEGRHDEADKALEEFRKQYPDYRISEEMLQKVERKK